MGSETWPGNSVGEEGVRKLGRNDGECNVSLERNISISDEMLHGNKAR